MATSLTTATHTLVVTCHATAGFTSQFDLGENIQTVSIQGFDSTGLIGTACYYSRVAQTEGTIIDPNRKTVSAGGMIPIGVSRKGHKLPAQVLHVASSVSLGKVELIISDITLG